MRHTTLVISCFLVGSSFAVKDWNDVLQYSVVAASSYYDLSEGWYGSYEDYYQLCHDCVRGGGDYWQHPNFPPFITMYTNLDPSEDLLFNYQDGGDDDMYRCFPPTITSHNYDNHGLWYDYTLELHPYMWKSGDWNSVNIAMAACPILPGKCPGEKERSYFTTDADNGGRENIRFTQFNDFTTYEYDNEDEHNDYDFCTYKIHAATGAPGFNIKSDIASNHQYLEQKTDNYDDAIPQMYATWVEYDSLHLSSNNEYGTWPPAHETVHMAECGANCVQGMLHPRATIDHEGVLHEIPS